LNNQILSNRAYTTAPRSAIVIAIHPFVIGSPFVPSGIFGGRELIYTTQNPNFASDPNQQATDGTEMFS
jgi:hypothetical protein